MNGDTEGSGWQEARAPDGGFHLPRGPKKAGRTLPTVCDATISGHIRSVYPERFGLNDSSDLLD